MSLTATNLTEVFSSIGIGFLTPEIIASILGIMFCVIICINDIEEMRILLFPIYFAQSTMGFYPHPIAIILAGIICAVSVFDPEAVATFFTRTEKEIG